MAQCSHYTREYFTKRRCDGITSWEQGKTRIDTAAAYLYAYGVGSFDLAVQILGGRKRVYDWRLQELSALAALHKRREPKLVLDVGCGRGELAVAFNGSARYWGCDPSPGSKTLVPETLKRYGIEHEVDEAGVRFGDGNMVTWHAFLQAIGLETRTRENALWWGTDEISPVDTLIFCESIEHIPADHVLGIMPVVAEMLAGGGLLIVVNWPGYHPIPVDRTGWDHITRIDNKYFDKLAGYARKEVLRHGSHLVLAF